MRVLPGGSAGPPVEGFEVAYADRDGAEFRLPLVDAWAVRFEDVTPVRASKSPVSSGSGIAEF